MTIYIALQWIVIENSANDFDTFHESLNGHRCFGYVTLIYFIASMILDINHTADFHLTNLVFETCEIHAILKFKVN